MSRTTFQIGASMQATFPNHKITQLKNYQVSKAGEYTEVTIVGVMVRWSATANEVHWCYI